MISVFKHDYMERGKNRIQIINHIDLKQEYNTSIKSSSNFFICFEEVRTTFDESFIEYFIILGLFKIRILYTNTI